MKYKKKNARTYHEHKGYYISPLTHDIKKPLHAAAVNPYHPHGHAPAKWGNVVEDDVDFLEGIIHPFSAAPEDDE